jgi:hypothetical protein
VVGAAITTTTEHINGLMLLTGDTLRLQWRVSRATQHIGSEIRTDVEIDPVFEVEVPITALAGAEVRLRWWHRFRLPRGIQLVLRAADLRAFEVVAGKAGLLLSHPAELVIPVRPADHVSAREFAAELNLALAEMGESGRVESGRRRLREH